MKSARKLKRRKSRRFRKLVSHLEHSAFYAKTSMNNPVLEDFPVIDKNVFMEHFDEINTCGINKEDAFDLAFSAERSRDFTAMHNGITIGLSTGTSGNKGIFLANEKERAMWVSCVLERVIGFSFRKRTIAFFLRSNSTLYESANSGLLDFHFFDLLETHENNFNRLEALNADILVAQPSALLRIAKSYIERQLKPGYRQVISVAEVLEERDRIFLESVFGLRLDQVYQCTEGFLACTCSHGTLHFNNDFLIIEKEYIDKASGRYHPIITDLKRYTQPVVRYRLDDILIEGNKCPCGSSFETIEMIEGRADDVIQLKDKTGKTVDIYPDFFRNAIVSASPDIREYILIQKDQSLLEIWFESEEGLKDKTREKIDYVIGNLLKKLDLLPVKITYRADSPDATGNKLRRIRNEYKKSS